MDMFSVLQKNSDAALGAGLGVVFAPQILNALGGMLDLGTYETVITSLGVAGGTLALVGGKKPAMAASFSAVFITYALLSVFPQLQGS